MHAAIEYSLTHNQVQTSRRVLVGTGTVNFQLTCASPIHLCGVEPDGRRIFLAHCQYVQNDYGTALVLAHIMRPKRYSHTAVVSEAL